MTLPRIGVFDSGVGGLTVLKAISGQMAAQYLYFGDTARLPYGTKSAETVARYSIGAAHFLESQDIDLLVIACNSATALALPKIRQAAHIPVIGVVEPGAAMAAEVSKTRAAIVIATEATVSSHAYRDALQQHGLLAYEKACPLLVPLVEEGWTDHPVTEQVAKIYLSEAMALASSVKKRVSKRRTRPGGVIARPMKCKSARSGRIFAFANAVHGPFGTVGIFGTGDPRINRSLRRFLARRQAQGLAPCEDSPGKFASSDWPEPPD